MHWSSFPDQLFLKESVSIYETTTFLVMSGPRAPRRQLHTHLLTAALSSLSSTPTSIKGWPLSVPPLLWACLLLSKIRSWVQVDFQALPVA